MKTKLYILIAGLLMAACATSFGQEIVSEFSPQTACHYNGIVETSSGDLLIGCGTKPINHDFVIYKATTDGTFLDSVSFVSTYQLLEIPTAVDTFLVVGFSIDYSNSVGIYNLVLTLIDAELNTIRESSIPVGTYQYQFWDYLVFISPENEIIFPYSKGNGDAFHIMRIGLDFNVLEDKAIPELPRGIWNENNTNDSVLFYTDIKAISTSPLRYHCLGYYKNAQDSIIFTDYLLGSDFNLIGSTGCSLPDPNTSFCDNNYYTAVTPIIEEATSARFGLMATDLRANGYNYQLPTILKYNDKGINVASLSLSGNDPSTGCRKMIAKDPSAIYFTYGTNSYYQHTILTKLNSNLELAWMLPLSYEPYTISYENTLKILSNGDILVGVILYYLSDDPILRVYIISDCSSTVPETKSIDKSFTLYPNPVKDQLTLRFNDSTKPESVELYDLAGRVVGIMPNGMESIDMSALPTGVYMLRITMKDGTCYHEKIMKE